jgi:hypothetical protein
MADFSVIDGKVVGGQGGEGVLIESLVVKTDKNAKTGDDQLWAEVAGVGHTYLNNPYAPEQGFKELPEPIPVQFRVDFLKDDLSISFDMISRAFGLKEPLEDKEGEVLRFTKDAEDSIYNEIYGQRAFFKAKLANGKVGDKPSDFYFNPQSQAKVVENKKDSVMDILKRIKGKKAAKEAAANDFAMTGTDEKVPF